MTLAELLPILETLPAALTAPQIADLYGVSVDHVYSETRAGTWPTPVIRIGRAYRYPTVPALEALGLRLLTEAAAGSD